MAHSNSWKQKACQGLIYRSWWVFLFLFLCGAVCSHAMNKKRLACGELEGHLAELSQQRTLLLQENEDLTVQINSQSDPAWIELTLMKGLGVVPEGQLKVYFPKQCDKQEL